MNSRTAIPENAIYGTLGFNVLVGLISVGSSVAFDDLIAMAVSALYASYFVTCVALLYRRCTGSIVSTCDSRSYGRQNLPGREGRLVWGPWHVPGVLGVITNAAACIYLAIVFFFQFWPTQSDVNAANMNYNILVFGVTIVASSLYYMVSARRTFSGPIVEGVKV